MKTTNLIGPALDWAVAKCEGHGPVWDEVSEQFFLEGDCTWAFLGEFSPSTDWSRGGPIIDREKIDIVWEEGQPHARTSRMVRVPGGVMTWCTTKGPTPLIAAMRCYVCSRLGNEVDIPKESL